VKLEINRQLVCRLRRPLVYERSIWKARSVSRERRSTGTAWDMKCQ